MTKPKTAPMTEAGVQHMDTMNFAVEVKISPFVWTHVAMTVDLETAVDIRAMLNFAHNSLYRVRPITEAGKQSIMIAKSQNHPIWQRLEQEPKK